MKSYLSIIEHSCANLRISAASLMMAKSNENLKLEANYDPLFANGIRGWLADMGNMTPEDSLDQLDALIEAQKEFSPKGDCLLIQMKYVRNTMRNLIAGGKHYARMMRERTKRAGERAGLPADWLSAPLDKYQNPSPSAQTCPQRERPTPAKRVRNTRDYQKPKRQGAVS